MDWSGGGPDASWLTVKVTPAIVIVPCRVEPAFAATLKLTFPFPLPLEPDVIRIHAALLDESQGQVLPLLSVAITPTVSEPPIDGKVSLVEVSV